jgi:hypothetical protein
MRSLPGERGPLRGVRVKGLIAPKALLIRQEQQKFRALGKYPRYEDTRPMQDGLINLRGHVTAADAAHFVAVKPGGSRRSSSAGKKSSSAALRLEPIPPGKSYALNGGAPSGKSRRIRST